MRSMLKPLIFGNSLIRKANSPQCWGKLLSIMEYYYSGLSFWGICLASQVSRGRRERWEIQVSKPVGKPTSHSHRSWQPPAETYAKWHGHWSHGQKVLVESLAALDPAQPLHIYTYVYIYIYTCMHIPFIKNLDHGSFCKFWLLLNLKPSLQICA